jgi:hypothetical protein
LTEAGGATTTEPGAELEPDRPPGADGETGASGVCGTMLGVDGLKLGGGGVGTGLTGCAPACPMVKAAITPAAKNATAGRLNPIIVVSLSSAAHS